MCFKVDKSFKTRAKAKELATQPRIARTNITVYKWLVSEVFGSGIKKIIHYHSPHRVLRYRPGETKTAEKFSFRFVDVCGWRSEINKGIHSYHWSLAKELLKRQKKSFTKYNNVLIKCTIPKGTPYFKNNIGEYVSLALKTPAEYKHEKFQ